METFENVLWTALGVIGLVILVDFAVGVVNRRLTRRRMRIEMERMLPELQKEIIEHQRRHLESDDCGDPVCRALGGEGMVELQPGLWVGPAPDLSER